jgi:hypothetical protein
MIVNDELEGIWKEVEVAWFDASSPLLCGEMQEDHEEPRSGEPVSGPRYELVTSRIRRVYMAT